jgi:hypothetical protein
METIVIKLTRSARLVWIEINLFGEIVETVINHGPREQEKIENLINRILEDKGCGDYTIHSTSALSENQYECIIGKVAS